MSGHLCFENVTRRFGTFAAVSEVTLEIGKGEVFSLLGPSGCGKTTLLRMAAGFDRPDTGRILLDGKDITSMPPDRRPVNTVFQNYALFPHLSVRENISFGPKIAKRAKSEVRADVDRMLELVDLAAHADKKPAQLSGGQKQRVAIARALVNRPEVLLLDEPLAALDLKLRQRLLVELDALHDEVGITFVYVTHDQSEAMSFSDRIAVMNKGKVEQIGSPMEIYEAPRSSFVASFIGDTNFLVGTSVTASSGGLLRCQVEGLGEISFQHRRTMPRDGRVHLSLRPEKVRVSREQPARSDHQNYFPAVVDDVVYFGSHTRCWLRCGSIRICAELRNDLPPTPGEAVWLQWMPEDGYVLEQYREEDEPEVPIE